MYLCQFTISPDNHYSYCMYKCICVCLFVMVLSLLVSPRILSCQEELNSARREARTERAEVERYVQLEKMFFEKKSEKERLITRLKLLRAQLQELESPQKEGLLLIRGLSVLLMHALL